jgi:hypothetical protein
MSRWIRAASALSVAMLVVATGRHAGDGTAAAANVATSRVAGPWSYEVSHVSGTLSGAAVECSVSGLTMTLTQSASTLTGSASGGTLTCLAAGRRVTDEIGTVTVTHGSIDGRRVVFDLGSPDWRSEGRVHGDWMGGSLPLTVRLAGQVVVLSGDWVATRQMEDGGQGP